MKKSSRQPRSSFRRFIPAGALTALGLGWFVWITVHGSDAPSSPVASSSLPSLGLPSSRARDALPSIPNPGPLPFDGASGPAPSAVTAGPIGTDRVASLMKTWREAIVVKNPEPVERLDRLFAERPSEFLGALMVSAETDPEERVRSFSTRVLGKLRQSDGLAVLRRLLHDPSVYVRFNAAWALGELTDRQALATLLRLEKRDPSPLVRQSAGASRRKIEGG